MDQLEAGWRFQCANDLDSAAAAYSGVLAGNGGAHQAAFLLGTIKLQQEAWGEAVGLLSRAVSESPSNSDYHVALGIALKSCGDLSGALTSYERALHLAPESADAHNNMGALQECYGNCDRAIASYLQALSLRPTLTEANYNLANLLRTQGSLEASVNYYRRVLALNESHRYAAVNLALVLTKLGDFLEAEKILEQYLATSPKEAKIVSLLGYTKISLGKWTEAAQLLTDYFGRASLDFRRTPSPSTLRHSVQQLSHISNHGGGSSQLSEIIQALEHSLMQIERDSSGEKTELALSRFSTLMNQGFQIERCDKLEASSLSSNIIIHGAQTDLVSSAASHIVIDDLLSDAALTRLRGFCLNSTIWTQSSCDSELLTNLESGFACPLLFQIADELKTLLPELLQEKHLIMAWAYRYLGNGPEFGPHADPGQTTVNLWLTPDESNLDVRSGGLRIWDITAPAGYIGQPRDVQTKLVAELMALEQKEPTIVPYRCNRAVVFNSTTLHSTDQFRFRTGFADRRMNITLLFDGASDDFTRN